MMRRHLPVVLSPGQAAPLTAVCVACRYQSSGTSHTGSRGGGSDSGQSRLHTFIRDNTAQSGSSSRVGGGRGQSAEVQTSFHNTPSASPQSSGYRGSGGGGGGRGDRRATTRGSFSANNGASVAAAAAVAGGGDWAVQLRRELLRDEDPLGGLAHPDYFRDPATGYSPQYAPRNFADGGAIEYPHRQTETAFSQATAARAWSRHDAESAAQHAESERARMRSVASAEERQKYLSQGIPADRFAGHFADNASLHPLDQLRHSTVSSAEVLRRQAILDRHQHARDGQHASATPASAIHGGLASDDLFAHVEQQSRAATDDTLDEHLRIAHGLRAKERHDHTLLQRTSRIPFRGYDQDRHAAQQAGTPYGAQQVPPATPASSMEEAQKALRGGAVPAVEAALTKAHLNNTSTDNPQLGEGLTESVVDALRASRETEKQRQAQARKQRFGLGRQGALVQDGGPDRRVLKKHQNDERLLDAMRFSSDAYRKTATDEHADPYVRGNTQTGVGHLLTNAFDIARREDRVSQQKPDLTERATVHYGVPVQQSLDEYVFRHRNARGERPLDYFKPFPDFRAMRLNRMYQDVEGFSLMKQRPDFLEWELFTRYRAHHQQRRDLALRHGLEPVVNETAQERDARRRALDELCERTPFDEAHYLRRHDDEQAVSCETLRNWFGVYMLPSPKVVDAVIGTKDQAGSVGLHLHHLNDELGTADTREHVMSSRYVNKLLLFEGYQHRLGRGFVNDVVGRAPEPVIKYAQSPETLRHFTEEERRMYEAYVEQETKSQLEAWQAITKGRRFLAEKQQYGRVVSQAFPVTVVDVQDVESGALMTIAASRLESTTAATAAAAAAANATTGDAQSSPVMVQIDGVQYQVVPKSERSVVPLTVQLDSGDTVDMTDEAFSECPLEQPASTMHNHALNYGIGNYAYNRGNYVETQDALWESATAKQVEGWSPATHADGLREGLPVRARRSLTHAAAPSVPVATTGSLLKDPRAVPADRSVRSRDFQRGCIISYHHQPFFNPEPRLVTIEFDTDGHVEQVPLADVLIWQRQPYGPDRTHGDESRRHPAAALRRYVDVADPHNEKTAEQRSGEPHFLDKYEVGLAQRTADKFRTTKQITELDQWNRFDMRRPENHRPLSISHRRDYIRQGYMHRYTPWEWIAVQEADQPIVHETMRQDNLGSSHVFSLNRYWRHKARPHGYIRNYENEVRDLLQFVDGVTPWKQAQKIRTYWEVREHHPMPQFNRPEVAMHRNHAGLLPSHLWETDKKTGKVKAVKDSVRDYQTKTPVPKWVQL